MTDRPHAAPNLFWRIWDKTWFIFCTLIFVGIIWANNVYGTKALIQGFFACFILIGALTLVYGWKNWRRAIESANWRPAEAHIVSSKVKAERSSGLSRSNTGSRSAAIEYYEPQVEYQYGFEGVTYTSSKVILVNTNWSRDDAEAVVARYPAGACATAWVDPSLPSRVVLEPGLAGKKAEYRTPFLVGGVFTIFGIGGWILLSALAW